MAWSNTAFYIVFLAQIILLSYVVPRKLLGRMQHVLRTYPPAEYPKLYPRPESHYHIAHDRFRLVNNAIFAIGLVVLFSIMFLVDHSTFADDGYISEAFPAAYGMLQMVPLMILELSEFSHLKLMRRTNPSPTRRADLKRRRVTDLVSPALIATVLFIGAGSIFYDFYVHDFAVGWGHDTAQRTITLLVTNLALLAVGLWQVHGKKLDPHQTSEDRWRRAAVSIRSLLYVSIAMSIYFMTAAADDVYDIDALDAILMSVYFQVVVLISVVSVLNAVLPEEMNFDVYKVS